MKIGRVLPVLALLALGVLCPSAQAIKLPPPPTKAQLAGVWVGPDESGAVWQLELDGQGLGKLQISERGSLATVSRYNVTLNKERYTYRLLFAVRPIGGSTVHVTLTGYAAPGAQAITLVRHFSDPSDGLALKALLIRKNELLQGAQRLQDGALPSDAR